MGRSYQSKSWSNHAPTSIVERIEATGKDCLIVPGSWPIRPIERNQPLGTKTFRDGQWAVATFLFGNGISLIGNALMMVALPWFVLETTGSAGRTGLIGMMSALPALASGILGGVVVDRLGGRRMSVVADIVSGVAVLLIPLFYQTVGLNFIGLMLLVFAGAALDIPGITGRRLLLPELARGAKMRDEAVTS